ncbi:MAG: sugar-transfer associated ATP-grasp domain-containing protein [Leeuwenhoekiella sp.]
MKLIYFFYLLKSTDYSKLWEYITFVSEEKEQSKLKTVYNVLRSFAKYNTSFLDYFYLEFYKKNDAEVASYASTLLMHRFHKNFNDKNSVKYFKNKKLFYEKFQEFIKHDYFIPENKSTADFEKWLSKISPNGLMAKKSSGQAGLGLEKIDIVRNNGRILLRGKEPEEFLAYARSMDYDLLDTYVKQHQDIENISPDALSTIRVISVVDKNRDVHILGAMIRMSTGSFVDNFHKGGVSAAVDLDSGKLVPPMLFQDPRKSKTMTTHPVTKEQVIGFIVPFWQEVIPMIKKAALVIPNVRTVGWDVIITAQGPSLLEGNDNWDKTHYEKINGHGLKETIQKFLKNN